MKEQPRSLAKETIGRLKESGELRIQAGIGSMDDTKVKVIQDMLTRVDLEMAGIDSDQFSVDDILEGVTYAKEDHSMDDASAYTARQLEDFDYTRRDVEYADIDYLSWFPVISPKVGATKHTFFLEDMQGEFKTITGASTDLPLSHISGEEHTANIIMGGGSIEWNQQELDSANFGNVDVQGRKGRSIVRAHLEWLAARIVVSQDGLVGFDTDGIDEAALADSVVNPNTVSGTALKYWINKDGREIVADLIGMRDAIYTGTLGRWGGTTVDVGIEGSMTSFTLTMPLAAVSVLFKKYMHSTDGGTRETVWEYLQSPMGKMATGITRYRVIHGFTSAFSSNTVPGIMLTPNDPNAFRFLQPKSLTPLPVQFKNLSMMIPFYAYFGGLEIIRNKALVKRYNVQAA